MYINGKYWGVYFIREKVDEELGLDGRLLLRASGTENVIRIMIEASDLKTCDKYTKLIEDVIIKKGYVV